jgi:predicted 3-demethylubiquinone-9 3-methyltransferase (glyoxalase superfamily)
MTIEEAIELLQERYMTVSMCMSSQDRTKQNAALDMAIAALREKAEREKGCGYCNSRFGIASHHVNQAGMQAGTNRNAKCCPECGKRLEVEHE